MNYVKVWTFCLYKWNQSSVFILNINFLFRRSRTDIYRYWIERRLATLNRFWLNLVRPLKREFKEEHLTLSKLEVPVKEEFITRKCAIYRPTKFITQPRKRLLILACSPNSSSVVSVSYIRCPGCRHIAAISKYSL